MIARHLLLSLVAWHETRSLIGAGRRDYRMSYLCSYDREEKRVGFNEWLGTRCIEYRGSDLDAM